MQHSLRKQNCLFLKSHLLQNKNTIWTNDVVSLNTGSKSADKDESKSEGRRRPHHSRTTCRVAAHQVLDLKMIHHFFWLNIWIHFNAAKCFDWKKQNNRFFFLASLMRLEKRFGISCTFPKLRVGWALRRLTYIVHKSSTAFHQPLQSAKCATRSAKMVALFISAAIALWPFLHIRLFTERARDISAAWAISLSKTKRVR